MSNKFVLFLEAVGRDFKKFLPLGEAAVELLCQRLVHFLTWLRIKQSRRSRILQPSDSKQEAALKKLLLL